MPLDPAATRLEAPAGATVDADGTVVVVPGEGRYELDRTAGTVLFTPEPAFTGTATPVPYVVTDAAGATAASTLTPSMTEVARPDTSTGEQGIPQRLAVTENDGGAVPVSPATLRLVDPSGVDAATVVVPGEGTWTVGGEVLVFTPEPAFVGTATPVSYRVDTAAGDTVESTATPTVTAAPVVPPVPVVTAPDVVVTVPACTPAVFDLPAAVPDLVPGSVALILPNQTPAEEVTTDDGTWQVQPTTGQVTFTPSSTVVGDPAPSPSPPSAPTAPPRQAASWSTTSRRQLVRHLCPQPARTRRPPAVPSRGRVLTRARHRLPRSLEPPPCSQAWA